MKKEKYLDKIKTNKGIETPEIVNLLTSGRIAFGNEKLQFFKILFYFAIEIKTKVSWK